MRPTRGPDVAHTEHPGEGTPIVLIHGVGSSRDTWADIPRRLADAGHHVVALDLLGHGRSGLGNGDFSLGANASAVRDLLDHLGLGQVHLVGHSLGGGVAMQFAYQFPHRVETLTLVSSGGLGPDVSARLRAATLPGAELVLRAASAPRTVRSARWIGRQLAALGVDVDALGPRTMDRVEALRDERRAAALLSTLRSVVGPDGQRVYALDRLAWLDPRRVLIVWGAEDATLPVTHGIQAHEHLDGSRLVIVPDADHHPHTDAPEVVVDAILQHVSVPVC